MAQHDGSVAGPSGGSRFGISFRRWVGGSVLILQEEMARTGRGCMRLAVQELVEQHQKPPNSASFVPETSFEV